MNRVGPIPAREWGGRLPVALVFPEQEPQALSCLGWQTVYRELGYDDGFYVERFFWDKDARKAVSPDSDKKLGVYPLICFSLNFEGDYLCLINILKAEDIAVRADERKDWPLVMAGGPIAFLNPFPVAPSLDFLFVGESEGKFAPVAHAVRDQWLSGNSCDLALQKISEFPGVLIPGQKNKVRKQISIKNHAELPSPSCSSFVSASSVFRDSFLVEINRGCPYGCRFCAAGFIYRPPRQSSLSNIKQLVQDASPRKVGLVGTALTDWPDLKPFLVWLHNRQIKFSLSSVRADGLDRNLLEFLRKCGTRTITLAVEGVSQNLRAAMNKHFNQDRFFDAVELISELRFNTLKLYFILGLPGEDADDFAELASFLDRLEQARKVGMGKKNKGVDLISISASMFVPKPWTPLQWAPMESQEMFLKKTKIFKKMCSGYKGLKFSAEKPFGARLQGLLSRGDEKVHDLLVLAAENDNSWRNALKLWPGNMEDYIDREFSLDTDFVWDVIDIGIDKDYLKNEWIRYHKALPTRICPDQPCHKCTRCGMEKFMRIDNRQHGQAAG
ncbi:MAG: radical SAM protein [Desulfonatronovibrio sp.]